MPGLIHGIEAEKVRANLERVREAAGDSVEILVATKYVPLEEMGTLAEAGVRLVGENRQQDLVAKHERWGDAFEWDFIGNLQSRKVKQVLPVCRLVHSVATDSVLRELGKHGGPDTEVLVEVNVAGEEGKGGVDPEDLPDFIERCPVTRRRTDDDAAFQPGSRGLAAPFRPPGRARGRQRFAASLDGNLTGLAGRGRGGGDDHPPRHRTICVNRR